MTVATTPTSPQVLDAPCGVAAARPDASCWHPQQQPRTTLGRCGPGTRAPRPTHKPRLWINRGLSCAAAARHTATEGALWAAEAACAGFHAVVQNAVWSKVGRSQGTATCQPPGCRLLRCAVLVISPSPVPLATSADQSSVHGAEPTSAIHAPAPATPHSQRCCRCCGNDQYTRGQPMLPHNYQCAPTQGGAPLAPVGPPH